MLVTKDINMRIKAKGSGLVHVEDYRRDRVLDDIDLLVAGHRCRIAQQRNRFHALQRTAFTGLGRPGPHDRARGEP